jgi:hypothetical protein
MVCLKITNHDVAAKVSKCFLKNAPEDGEGIERTHRPHQHLVIAGGVA